MTLAVQEWRKLVRLPALWVFVALCFAFNAALIVGNSYGRDFFNDTGAAASVLGQRVDGSFLTGLSQRRQSENRDTLIAAVTGLENKFSDYDTGSLSRFYEEQVKESPLAVKWMRWKYEKVADRVAHLAETGAAMDLYAGPITHDAHSFLFGVLLRAVTMESCALVMLAMLFSLGYERMTRTETTFCATRTGRRLWRIKIAAGVSAAPALYLVLLLPALGLYFSLWDYGGIWSASVSSQFNYIRDLFQIKPFLTWADFTVAGYLAASLILGAALTAVFSLLAAVCGTLIRNTYLAALTLILLCVGGLSIAAAFANLKWWTAYLLSCLQPVSLWLGQSVWFTESGMNAVLPWSETVGVGINLAVLGGGAALAIRRFDRKDVM